MATTGNSLAGRATALAAQGGFLDAYRLLTSPQARTDPEALFMLGIWRLSGDVIGRDLTASREFFRRSAEAGHDQGASAYTAFVGNGTGGPADWQAALDLLRRFSTGNAQARRQLDVIGQMDLSDAGEPLAIPAETRLSDQPRVSCFSSLFSTAECDFLIAEAEPLLRPAVVIDPRTGATIRNPIRTSDSMAFPWIIENPAIHALNRRIAIAAGTGVTQGEPLQVLRYRPGQEYKPHIDAIAGDPNQRIVTALVYLNDAYEGGETLFVRTGLRFKGARGDALVFHNALPDGRPDDAVQHAGLPVTVGEKIIGSRWIRARPFAVAPPRPFLDV